jgi:transposase
MSEGVGATVTAALRETIAAVKFLNVSGQGVSVTAVAKHLNLDKSSATRRTAVGIQQGYLRNLEERKGRPARLVLGETLPDEAELLPSTEALQCCAQEVEGGEHTIEVEL